MLLSVVAGAILFFTYLVLAVGRAPQDQEPFTAELAEAAEKPRLSVLGVLQR